jgi:hypothetical protein
MIRRVWRRMGTVVARSWRRGANDVQESTTVGFGNF